MQNLIKCWWSMLRVVGSTKNKETIRTSFGEYKDINVLNQESAQKCKPCEGHRCEFVYSEISREIIHYWNCLNMVINKLLHIISLLFSTYQVLQ